MDGCGFHCVGAARGAAAPGACMHALPGMCVADDRQSIESSRARSPVVLSKSTMTTYLSCGSCRAVATWAAQGRRHGMGANPKWGLGRSPTVDDAAVVGSTGDDHHPFAAKEPAPTHPQFQAPCPDFATADLMHTHSLATTQEPHGGSRRTKPVETRALVRGPPAPASPTPRRDGRLRGGRPRGKLVASNARVLRCTS